MDGLGALVGNVVVVSVELVVVGAGVRACERTGATARACGSKSFVKVTSCMMISGFVSPSITTLVNPFGAKVAVSSSS